MVLSLPSYIMPGTYLENVLFLSEAFPAVKNVELLFFYYDSDTRRLFDSERQGLESMKNRFGYTLHLPDTLLPEHREFVAAVQHAVRHFIVHPPRDDSSPSLESFLPEWISRFGRKFLLENTVLPRFKACRARLPEMPVCVDVGHLLLEGVSPARFLRKEWDEVREIHLHGVKNGKDHTGFDADEPWFRELVPLLGDFDGVINLEVFSAAEANRIIQALSSVGLVSGETENPGGTATERRGYEKSM
jgi:hypothetical protein